jgi:hypothetical protein
MKRSWFGLVGYMLSFIAYMMFVPEALQHYPIIIGMILVSAGYIILFVREVYGKVIEKTKAKPEDKRSMWKNARKLHVAGFALLAAFFFLIHIYPNVTFHLRFYDIFAAIGYIVAFFNEFGYIPAWIAYVPLVVYYALAGSVKVFEKGWAEKLQLISRLLLAFYYGMHLI